MKELINQVRKELCNKCEICKFCMEYDDFCIKFAEKLTDLAFGERK